MVIAFAEKKQTNKMATPSVNVCVESVIENQIQEVTYDGQEIYVAPLSMSENLSKLAYKIDFYKDESEEKGKPTSEGEKETEEDKVLAPFQPSLWPWDSVRNKMKAALQEMSVLYDVLNIVKEKHYMVTDPVSQDPPELKASLQMLAKKKSLVAASQILTTGAERLKRVQAELSSATTSNGENFLQELLKLRRWWRLKKVHSTILGELSYKSAGSIFWQGGTFEVIKTSELGEAAAGTGSLDVSIPSQLEGVAYIQVEVKSVPDMSQMTSATLKMPMGLGSVCPETYWQKKLEFAQNVLFCKELFAQLAREAVQVRGPHVVVGNQIVTSVFPGVQLSVVLCHYTGKEKKSSEFTKLNADMVEVALAPHKLEHNHVLEHSLHQLLRRVHDRNLQRAPPHPVNATLGMSKRRRLAGPAALTRGELMEMSPGESLLEQILRQARHDVIRAQSARVLDELAVQCTDLQLTAHWSCLNNGLQSSVRLGLTAAGYEIIRNSLSLLVGPDWVRATLKDGRVITLSFEEAELRDLLLSQVSQHYVMCLLHLAKVNGWTALSVNQSSGFSDPDASGTASTATLVSPRGHVTLAFHSTPAGGQRLYVRRTGQDTAPAVMGAKWASLAGDFQEINISQMEGRNLVAKLDMLMARLIST